MKSSDRFLRKILIGNIFAFLAGEVLTALTSLADEITVARGLGSSAIAAFGLASPFFPLLSLFARVMAVGAQSMCAFAMGTGDAKRCRTVYSSLLFLVTMLSLSLTSVGFLLLDPICVLFGAETKAELQVYMLLRDYMKGMALTVPGYIVCTVLSPLVLLNGGKKCMTVAVFLQAAINISGDIASVFLLNLGISGVGLFTALSWFAASAVIFFFLLRTPSFRFDRKSVDFKCFKEMFWIGSPQLSKYVSKTLSRFFLNRIVLLFGGSLALSVISINHGMKDFLYMFGGAAEDCAVLYIQLMVAEKERGEIHRSMRLMMEILAVSTGILMIFTLVFSKQLSLLFVVDDDVLLKNTVVSFIWLAFAIPICAVNRLLAGYLQGARQIKRSSVMLLFHRCISPVVTTLVFGWLWGPYGIYAAVPVSEVLSCLFYLCLTLFSGSGAEELRDRLLLIPPDFYSSIREIKEFIIQSREDVICASESVSFYFRQSGYSDPKTAFRLALCIEEMAMNIVTHGFTMDTRKHNCSVKIIMYKNGRVTVRIRDDCPKFDLKEKYELMCDSDAFANIGIRLILGMSKDVVYSNLLGMNNTVIQL